MCVVFEDYQWESSPHQPLTKITVTSPSQEEFDELKKEVELMKKMLEAAKIYDKDTGQPDCEMEEKIDFLKKVAKLVGVNLEEIFKN